MSRRYRTHAGLDTSQLLDLLTERLQDYGSTVRRIGPGQVLTAVGEALSHRGARRVVVPPGLDLAALPGRVAGWPGWPLQCPADVDFVVDDGLSPAELDAVDGVITAAAVAIAETGTIVLDGSPGQGRRVRSVSCPTITCASCAPIRSSGWSRRRWPAQPRASAHLDQRPLSDQ